MRDPGIVRNKLKIASAVANAKAFLQVQREFGGKPRQTSLKSFQRVPARTADSHAISKDLKQRGFNFVGSTICYAFMQAVGMVNDHVMDCFRYRMLS